MCSINLNNVIPTSSSELYGANGHEYACYLRFIGQTICEHFKYASLRYELIQPQYSYGYLVTTVTRVMNQSGKRLPKLRLPTSLQPTPMV